MASIQALIDERDRLQDDLRRYDHMIISMNVGRNPDLLKIGFFGDKQIRGLTLSEVREFRQFIRDKQFAAEDRVKQITNIIEGIEV
jgi:hypothetical protein